MDVDRAGPQPLDPRVRTEWVLERGALAGLAGVVGAAVGWAALAPWAGLAILAVGALIAASVVAWARIAFSRWRVTFADQALVLEHGVIWHTISTIPYARLQHVDVGRGPVERWLGLARVRLHTASASTDAEIPGLDAGAAPAVRDALLARSGTADAV